MHAEAGAVDAVDNCYTGTGNDQNGPFSNIYGHPVDGGLGPFDPLRRA